MLQVQGPTQAYLSIPKRELLKYIAAAQGLPWKLYTKLQLLVVGKPDDLYMNL